MDYKSALNKQRLKNQSATPIAGAPALTMDFMKWWARTFSEKFGFGAIAAQTTTMSHGDNTVWRVALPDLERVNEPGFRFVEVWAPAHIMRQALGCDIFVLGVPNG